MRIGLFTDTYHPSLNGIVYVVDITRRELEKMGHEVYVFCPKTMKNRLRRRESLQPEADPIDPHIIHFPSFKGVFYDDYDVSLFFPPQVVKKIEKLELDIVHFFTPGQIGLMGVYAAQKLDLPVVAQYCTDLYEYINDYKSAVPGMVALGATLPLTLKLDKQGFKELIKSVRPSRANGETWSKQTMAKILAILHDRCDSVITLSPKTQTQLMAWDKKLKDNIVMLPTGVDALPAPSRKQLAGFKSKLGLTAADKVLLYAGRLSIEKNLELLIEAMPAILASQPTAKLLFIGDDPDNRPKLQVLAENSLAKDSIIFAGRMSRQQLGVAYAAADIFVFPSVKDTQGLVLHEAALAGLPAVIIDDQVTLVVKDKVSGLVTNNNPINFASQVIKLLADDKLRAQYGAAAKRLAAKFSESRQAKKLDALYKQVVTNYVPRRVSRL